jgi:histidine triad (HIT) family protein
MSDVCVFCDIIAGRSPAKAVHRGQYAMAFEPLNPVTQGHTLVVPFEHVQDALDKPEVTGRAMQYASDISWRLGYAPLNIITSVGPEATQTVFHLHIHLVPRSPGDGLALPWSHSAEEV